MRVLVGKHGGHGRLIPVKPHTTVRAECIAWIDASNELRREPLTVEISVPTKQYWKFSKTLGYFRTAEVSGTLARRGAKYVFKAIGVKSCPANSALARVLKDIRPLPEITDATLGKLKLVAERDLYSKRVRFGGRLITLELEATTREDATTSLRAAIAVMTHAAKWTAWLNRFNATVLLKETNTTWREGMKPLTAAQLARQVALHSVTIREDRITLCLSAKGDLFGGHWVQLFVSPGMKFIDWDFIG